ncbi:glutamine synthetase family protein [Phaeobacter gallaeciensis]|jgi:glutamine synthetase|uniref:glutamine synthetase family protein n=1 Tax=Phaeobacter gallaeciensis TaxID=60890 RepID=UPI00237F94E2|nr:glutamine synthetase family protein [Phaeobacter gallaeciensis]MDE4063670.1 glutamine synthetase family protein [Phaeobacter gallaeciensis]MDE4126682.1 glutamine synthetase family protein [Phaeobacter gallaeciensis]MDE4131166.1 glutamine synthetase family protein [Phaeobacter gallaeciensis]
MINNPLIFAATSDIAGKVRGKAFPVADLEKRLKRGVGWTPTNVMITCFDAIADSPFGALGDLLLIPDQDAGVELDFEDGGPVERFMLGDITDLDGKPWDFCTRSLLKVALERLKAAGGVSLVSAFEHEFQFKTGGRQPGEGYGHGGFSARRVFGETLMAALDQSGLGADTIMKEYGVNQYEVTNDPAQDHRSADQAVILREVTRLTAKRLGEDVTFTPIRDPAGVGNGVHIHLSFLDESGAPATYDENGTAGMSKITGSFIAGVLKYLDSIIALTAPSDVSYLRLTPHRWSAAYNNLGFRDREASVRICPVTATDPSSVARQYNFEYRAADAAASPHLALAAIIHAGAQGIEDGLPAPKVTEEDLSILSADELEARGYVRLPETLESALQRFESNQTVCNWFPADFASVYVAHKRGEIAFLNGKDTDARCHAYEEVY